MGGSEDCVHIIPTSGLLPETGCGLGLWPAVSLWLEPRRAPGPSRSAHLAGRDPGTAPWCAPKQGSWEWLGQLLQTRAPRPLWNTNVDVHWGVPVLLSLCLGRDGANVLLFPCAVLWFTEILGWKHPFSPPLLPGLLSASKRALVCSLLFLTSDFKRRCLNKPTKTANHGWPYSGFASVFKVLDVSSVISHNNFAVGFEAIHFCFLAEIRSG